MFCIPNSLCGRLSRTRVLELCPLPQKPCINHHRLRSGIYNRSLSAFRALILGDSHERIHLLLGIVVLIPPARRGNKVNRAGEHVLMFHASLRFIRSCCEVSCEGTAKDSMAKLHHQDTSRTGKSARTER